MSNLGLTDCLLRLPIIEGSGLIDAAFKDHSVAWSWDAESDRLEMWFAGPKSGHSEFVFDVQMDLEMLSRVGVLSIREPNLKDGFQGEDYELDKLTARVISPNHEVYYLHEYKFMHRDSFIEKRRKYVVSLIACPDPDDYWLIRNGIWKVSSAELVIQGFTRLATHIVHYFDATRRTYHARHHALNFRLLRNISALTGLLVFPFAFLSAYHLVELVFTGRLDAAVLRLSLVMTLALAASFYLAGGRIYRIEPGKPLTSGNIWSLGQWRVKLSSEQPHA